MTAEEKFAKLKELLESNDEFAETFVNAGNPAASCAVAATKGVDLTEEELKEAMEQGKLFLEENGYLSVEGELSEKALDLVAGGRNWRAIVAGIVIGSASAAIGYGPGVVLGAGLIILGWNC